MTTERNEIGALVEVAYRESQRLAGHPDVVAVGCGSKRQGAACEGPACVRYFVRRKSLEPIAAREALPASVEGYPTDVVEVGVLSAAIAEQALPAGARGTRVAAPLVGGWATAGLADVPGSGGGFGTFGGICFDDASSRPLGLSSAHVWGKTVGAEVIQPVFPSSVFSTRVTPLANAAGAVRLDVPATLSATVTFANASAWGHILTGTAAADPFVFGQEATVVPDDTRTEIETLSIAIAAAPGAPPAGRELTSSVSWAYQRLSSSAELDAALTADRPNDALLRVQKASTDAASYAGNATVRITAELAGTSAIASVDAAHDLHAVALIYPQPNAERVVRRLFRPRAGQALPDAGRGLLYEASLPASELGRGSWAVSVIVQSASTGVAQSLNLTPGSDGRVRLATDCTFTVT